MNLWEIYDKYGINAEARLPEEKNRHCYYMPLWEIIQHANHMPDFYQRQAWSNKWEVNKEKIVRKQLKEFEQIANGFITSSVLGSNVKPTIHISYPDTLVQISLGEDYMSIDDLEDYMTELIAAARAIEEKLK